MTAAPDIEFLLSSFNCNGFACVNDFFSEDEVVELIDVIEQANQFKSTYRRSGDLFAIRQFLKEVPNAFDSIFNSSLKQLLLQFFGNQYFVSKSIYFDKPGQSNWFVAYHQDLTISVDQKLDITDFGPWTIKQNQFAVQPPVDILLDNFTVRIHLDNTTADNGALKVLSGSHLKGIRRIETLNIEQEHEVVCEVNRGGVMFMHPLIFHASGRTVNHNQRRVIHIEFSKALLPAGLNWSEKQLIN